jgi:hypothetical protein
MGKRGIGTALSLVVFLGCAAGSHDTFDAAADTIGDPAAEWDADAAPDSRPDAPADPDAADPDGEPAPDTAEDPGAEPATDSATDTGIDTPTDTASDPDADPIPDPGPDGAGVIWCVPDPPTDCTPYTMGCCASDRSAVLCYHGGDFGLRCAFSELCGPDSSTGYMECI